jgi:hypothetical protein
VIKESEPRTELRIRLAGFLAESRYWELVPSCPVGRYPSLSTSDDEERACAAASKLCIGNLGAASKLLLDLQATTETMVAGWWSRIERVAVALWESPTGNLTGQPLMDLLNGRAAATADRAPVTPHNP